MSHTRPYLARLGRLNLTNFPMGDPVIFCPACSWQADEPCSWQADEPCAMATVCPKCGRQLHLTRVTQKLVDLVRSASRHDLSHVFVHADRKGFYTSPPVPPKPPTPPVPWPQGLLAPCAPFVALRKDPHARVPTHR